MRACYFSSTASAVGIVPAVAEEPENARSAGSLRRGCDGTVLAPFFLFVPEKRLGDAAAAATTLSSVRGGGAEGGGYPADVAAVAVGLLLRVVGTQLWRYVVGGSGRSWGGGRDSRGCQVAAEYGRQRGLTRTRTRTRTPCGIIDCRRNRSSLIARRRSGLVAVVTVAVADSYTAQDNAIATGMGGTRL